MRIIALALALPLLCASINALAMVVEVSGETTCTTVDLVHKKILKQTSCHYKGSTGESMLCIVQQHNFQIPNHSTISTVNNATFRFGENEEMLDLVETITINDKKADVIHIDSRRLKKMSKEDFETLYEQSDPDFSKILHCFKPIKKTQAFCVPFQLINNIA